MSKLEKVSNKALSIQTTSQLVKLTKGQNIILKEITRSISKNKPITFDDIVRMYCDGVSNTHTVTAYKWDQNRRVFDTYITHKIYACYLENNSLFIYTLKPRIKNWFTNSIGILVIKGKLLAIPVIEEI